MFGKNQQSQLKTSNSKNRFLAKNQSGYFIFSCCRKDTVNDLQINFPEHSNQQGKVSMKREIQKTVLYDQGKASIVSDGHISKHSKRIFEGGQPKKHHSKNNSDLSQLAKSSHQNRSLQQQSFNQNTIFIKRNNDYLSPKNSVLSQDKNIAQERYSFRPSEMNNGFKNQGVFIKQKRQQAMTYGVNMENKYSLNSSLLNEKFLLNQKQVNAPYKMGFNNPVRIQFKKPDIPQGYFAFGRQKREKVMNKFINTPIKQEQSKFQSQNSSQPRHSINYKQNAMDEQFNMFHQNTNKNPQIMAHNSDLFGRKIQISLQQQQMKSLNRQKNNNSLQPFHY